ncbi:hypothetical protein [Brassicibacter mesophilus]|uniref:hypothetical protein n=1 Tax=Brassicibacter mesophilus TaxID=745119 RepID=UPI003D23C368
MEYFVSFIAFFAIYSCANILVEPIRKKYLVKKTPENASIKKKNSKNNKDNKKQSHIASNKENKREEIIGILKHSLIVSFIYVFVIFILKRFS